MKKVAVIEDEMVMSRPICEAFSDAGFKALPAYDGEEGLELVKKENPDFVLLDIYLPKKSGLQVLAELKASEETKNIPVLIFTASHGVEKMQEALDAGAVGFIAKSDFSVEDIVARVKSLLK